MVRESEEEEEGDAALVDTGWDAAMSALSWDCGAVSTVDGFGSGAGALSLDSTRCLDLLGAGAACEGESFSRACSDRNFMTRSIVGDVGVVVVPVLSLLALKTFVELGVSAFLCSCRTANLGA